MKESDFILLQMEPMHMSCKYCDVKEYEDGYDGRKTFYLPEGYYTDLSIAYDDEDQKYYLVARGDGVDEVEIKHCPMCGRKL